MSDISLDLDWFELVLISPVLGWPGLLLGGALGVLAWKRRRILGAVIGAIAGNFIVAAARLFA